MNFYSKQESKVRHRNGQDTRPTHRTRNVAFCISLLLAACSKPSPPLLPEGANARLEVIASGKAGQTPASKLDEITLRGGEALRARAQSSFFNGFISPAVKDVTHELLPEFGLPETSCPTSSPEGEICTFRFDHMDLPRTEGPRYDPNNNYGVGAGDKPAFIRIAVINGSASTAAPDSVRLHVKDDVIEVTSGLPAQLGWGHPATMHEVDCVAQLAAHGTTQRELCSLSYGPFFITVGHDLDRSKPSTDPEKTDLLKLAHAAVDVIDKTVALDPALWHILYPETVPTDATGDALARSIVASGELNNPANLPDTAGTKTASLASDANPAAAANTLAARYGVAVRWYEATDQAEWNMVCHVAAVTDKHMLIAAIGGPTDTPHPATFLYSKAMRDVAKTADLIVVRAADENGANAWAKAFAHEAGLGTVYPVIAVTDVPTRTKDGGCDVGKVYQVEGGKIDPYVLASAIKTGHPPKAK